ncbi:maleylpyruvate isomerase family mycothiol-dependent enzyme [Cellulomonas xiejunii]|uniref:Maleylpyruvate isomerase family mycothiol-dependent enzyme n=1 Tax=Cellulomonas xiejunii TaxID=2968083 RepID=A0ABY5KNI5_9CELL|nr:maleylpyruvate isomerase family mycothiol-dependent enzyme [Cellulomonas xiejunii]MCC2319728.1 maleylpyruvate isomerase family mycothiol-dependent enzyme [Cellulomonas xiejunii]UUI71334.1 maleylpyruvate isomerase family mycothiol-dependent enzyme [Cellulomonas xiejunii]
MRAQAEDVWQTVREERLRLADDLSGLREEQWAVPSLCPGWDVHDVLAHLVDTARTGRLAFVRDMVAARGDFDRANRTGVARERRTDPQDTVAALRQVADLRRTPPAPLATRLVEAVVHGEDVRRPLGLAGAYPARAVVLALENQLRTRVSLGGGRERVAGVRLVDRGSGRTWGAGEDLEADAVDLLLVVSGRPVPADRLAGAAASRFAAAPVAGERDDQ